MDSFLTFINQYGLDFKEDRTLLTVSGGIDSVVLANLFHKMGFKAGIAHCNFSLRGEESDEDERFVRSLAEHYGFEFFVKSFDVKSFAKGRSISTQMAARELRYAWFEEIRQSQHYRWIATAHHANDSFETVLLNLARGTGLAGLHGISAINGMLVRPLLYATRTEIQEYAETNDLKWREDRSNDTDDYKRNLLRHHAMPVFRQVNPSLESTFKVTSEKLASANQLLTEFLQNWEPDVVRYDADFVKIDIKKLNETSEQTYRLWFILEKYGFTYSQASQILKSTESIPGKMFFSLTHRLLVDRLEIILEKQSGEQQAMDCVIGEFVTEFIFENKVLHFERVDRMWSKDGAPEKRKIFIDAQSLSYPLKIRNWQEGDKFQPIGMKGKHKKISDLLTDLKMNRFEKERVRLLLNGSDEIIWVIGERPDERFKVTNDSKDVISITIQNRNV